MSVGADSNQHESISPEGVAKAAKFWKILQSYDTSARHEDIEHVLTLFRRGFDIRFLPIETSTILHISSLEAMLGRFRKFDDPIQLEDLVHELVKENKLSAQWFSQHGRKFRNELAHGNWQASEEGLHERNHLIAIIQEIIPQFISFWISQAQQSDKRPGAMFINHLNKQLKN